MTEGGRTSIGLETSSSIHRRRLRGSSASLLVVKLLLDAGMETDEKRVFQKKRRGWPRFEGASFAEKLEMIASNPKYGHVFCRCEQVTEAEILEAMGRGAVTLDAIKHLTRAGMGRCQGGFCGMSVLKVLAQHLGVPLTEVTKNGEGSHQVIKSLRDFI